MQRRNRPAAWRGEKGRSRCNHCFQAVADRRIHSSHRPLPKPSRDGKHLKAACSFRLTGGTNPSAANAQLTYTATITGGVPDGQTVLLEDASDNDAIIATGVLTDGSATLTVLANTLSVGTHDLIAVYGGDANHATSVSVPVPILVPRDNCPLGHERSSPLRSANQFQVRLGCGSSLLDTSPRVPFAVVSHSRCKALQCGRRCSYPGGG
jgi:hypothetical protein